MKTRVKEAKILEDNSKANINIEIFIWKFIRVDLETSKNILRKRFVNAFIRCHENFKIVVSQIIETQFLILRKLIHFIIHFISFL